MKKTISQILSQFPRDRSIMFLDRRRIVVRILPGTMHEQNLKLLRQNLKLKNFRRDDVIKHRPGRLETLEQWVYELKMDYDGMKMCIEWICNHFGLRYVTNSLADDELRRVQYSVVKLAERKYQCTMPQA